MSETRNNAGSTRGRPFEPGNPGRPPGARNKATRAIEALLEGEAENLGRKAVELALAGDQAALRLCIDRLAPTRRERPTPFDLPAVRGARDHPAAVAAVLRAVAAGDLAPGEGEALCRMLGEHRRSVELADLDARVAALEANK